MFIKRICKVKRKKRKKQTKNIPKTRGNQELHITRTDKDKRKDEDMQTH